MFVSFRALLLKKDLVIWNTICSLKIMYIFAIELYRDTPLIENVNILYLGEQY